MTPYVYRNARYEFRLARAEAQIMELAQTLAGAMGMIAQLAQSVNVEHQIPALPETPRAFGRGH